MDFDKWLSLWHHQALGPGSERSLLGQHLLQSSCSGHWHCTLEHDPQQRGSAHCQGFCTCTDIIELIKTAATFVSKYLHISTLTCSHCPRSVSLHIHISRWMSPQYTSHRICLMGQCIPWTATTLTFCWWKRIPTDRGPPVKWGWSCSNTSLSSALVMEVKPFGSLLGTSSGIWLSYINNIGLKFMYNIKS